jgi:hypothetical protein
MRGSSVIRSATMVTCRCVVGPKREFWGGDARPDHRLAPSSGAVPTTDPVGRVAIGPPDRRGRVRSPVPVPPWLPDDPEDRRWLPAHRDRIGGPGTRGRGVARRRQPTGPSGGDSPLGGNARGVRHQPDAGRALQLPRGRVSPVSPVSPSRSHRGGRAPAPGHQRHGEGHPLGAQAGSRSPGVHRACWDHALGLHAGEERCDALHAVDGETYADWETIYPDNVQRLYRLMYSRSATGPTQRT